MYLKELIIEIFFFGQLYLSLSKMVEKISENITSDIENSKSKGLIKSPEHLN